MCSKQLEKERYVKSVVQFVKSKLTKSQYKNNRIINFNKHPILLWTVQRDFLT